MTNSDPNPWPHFFVIGAGRSGTTSLHAYLSQHTDIYLPRKNLGYFYTAGLSPTQRKLIPPHFLQDESAYLSLFLGRPAGAVTGDVSPVYLASTRVAEKIALARPSARLVAIIRNPIDRVFSRYVARRRDGLEAAPTFEKLVEAESREPLIRDDAHATYLAGGIVSHFLETYLDHFPREAIEIQLYEDFARNTPRCLHEICGFLGVRETHQFDVSRIHNRGGGRIRSGFLAATWALSEPLRRQMRPLVSRSMREKAFSWVTRDTEPTGMLPATRALLQDLYSNEVTRLQALIGRDLSHWLR